jgi:hypothetical protein
MNIIRARETIVGLRGRLERFQASALGRSYTQ